MSPHGSASWFMATDPPGTSALTIPWTVGLGEEARKIGGVVMDDLDAGVLTVQKCPLLGRQRSAHIA